MVRVSCYVGFIVTGLYCHIFVYGTEPVTESSAPILTLLNEFYAPSLIVASYLLYVGLGAALMLINDKMHVAGTMFVFSILYSLIWAALQTETPITANQLLLQSSVSIGYDSAFVICLWLLFRFLQRFRRPTGQYSSDMGLPR